MLATASKRVLVIGPEHGLAAAVARELEAGQSPLTFVADHTLDWSDPAAVQAVFQSQPSFLLNEIDLRALASDEDICRELQGRLLERNQLLATFCAREGCAAMHLSDYHVFGGETKNAYDENDPVAPLDSFGNLVADLEAAFAGTLEQHLILRFSWLVDPAGDNLFTRILGALTDTDELVLSRYRRGAPTWRSDAQRVIAGVLRQMMAGAQNWGYFHYCSSDNCNEWEFGQEVEATLIDLQPASGKILADDLKQVSGFPLEPASATLNSRRIRDNFGVHGRSWRQGLKAQTSLWLDQRTQQQSASSLVGNPKVSQPGN